MIDAINYITLIGFVGQGLFFSRFAVQLFLSEKQKKVITPSIFWKLSLLASVVFFIYGYLREDFSIMLGQAFTYFIYIRNLQLQGEWKRLPKVFQIFLFVFPVFIVLYAYNNGIYDLDKLLSKDTIVFICRFIFQWITSERTKTSHLPLGFWRISLAGSLLILTYSIFREDLVLFLAHSIGMIVYVRNIFIWKKQVNESSRE